MQPESNTNNVLSIKEKFVLTNVLNDVLILPPLTQESYRQQSELPKL